ncbi:MAG: signal peptide peptidase SppA [Candidatus Longimicrobiales bacterium M2_2A_002]
MTLIAIMTLAGLGLAVFTASGAAPDLAFGGRIALLDVSGVINDDQTFLRDVRRLRRDGSVRGWVVSINSPGGVVAPSQSIYQTLNQLRTEDGVPVVASIGSVGASGGYYVALGADSILALPGSVTGSIGVIMEYPNVQELLGKVGVRMEVVKAGAQKDLGSPFRPMGPEDREVLSAMISDVHEQFIEAVSERRDMPVDAVRRLADGRVLSGRQAMEAGLVDRLGNLDDALAVAGQLAGLGPSPRIVRPPRPDRPWLLNALLGQATARAVQRILVGVAEPMTAWPTVRYMLR